MLIQHRTHTDLAREKLHKPHRTVNACETPVVSRFETKRHPGPGTATRRNSASQYVTDYSDAPDVPSRCGTPARGPRIKTLPGWAGFQFGTRTALLIICQSARLPLRCDAMKRFLVLVGVAGLILLAQFQA